MYCDPGMLLVRLAQFVPFSVPSLAAGFIGSFFVAFFQLSSLEPNFGLSQATRELSPLSSGEGSSLRSPTASTVSQLSVNLLAKQLACNFLASRL